MACQSRGAVLSNAFCMSFQINNMGISFFACDVNEPVDVPFFCQHIFVAILLFFVVVSSDAAITLLRQSGASRASACSLKMKFLRSRFLLSSVSQSLARIFNHDAKLPVSAVTGSYAADFRTGFGGPDYCSRGVSG
jgi:hypothetical protein